MTQATILEQAEEFIVRPKETILGVIDKAADAEQAIQALGGAGFAKDSVEICYGEAGEKRIDASGVQHGLLAQIIRLFQRTTIEREQAERYEQAIAQGHYVIAVHLSEANSREQARQILKSHSGHFINYYGRYAIHKLDP